MNASTLIVLLVVIIIAAFATKSSLGHFKGEGGCCGGGETILPDEKELAGTKIGEKTVHIEGMHCENCKNRVERAINRIDGAVGKVNLKKNIAVVSFEREISDEEIRKAVEEQDYRVLSIE